MTAPDIPEKQLIRISYSQPGSQPPIYLAGTFSNWQPEELEYTTNDANEHVFSKQIEVDEEKEYQYKFRIGTGDWWVVDESVPTVIDDAGNRNNLLYVPKIHLQESDVHDDHSIEDTQRHNTLETLEQKSNGKADGPFQSLQLHSRVEESEQVHTSFLPLLKEDQTSARCSPQHSNQDVQREEFGIRPTQSFLRQLDGSAAQDPLSLDKDRKVDIDLQEINDQEEYDGNPKVAQQSEDSSPHRQPVQPKAPVEISEADRILDSPSRQSSMLKPTSDVVDATTHLEEILNELQSQEKANGPLLVKTDPTAAALVVQNNWAGKDSSMPNETETSSSIQNPHAVLNQQPTTFGFDKETASPETIHRGLSWLPTPQACYDTPCSTEVEVGSPVSSRKDEMLPTSEKGPGLSATLDGLGPQKRIPLLRGNHFSEEFLLKQDAPSPSLDNRSLMIIPDVERDGQNSVSRIERNPSTCDSQPVEGVSHDNAVVELATDYKVTENTGPMYNHGVITMLEETIVINEPKDGSDNDEVVLALSTKATTSSINDGDISSDTPTSGTGVTLSIKGLGSTIGLTIDSSVLTPYFVGNRQLGDQVCEIATGGSGPQIVIHPATPGVDRIVAIETPSPATPFPATRFPAKQEGDDHTKESNFATKTSARQSITDDRPTTPTSLQSAVREPRTRNLVRAFLHLIFVEFWRNLFKKISRIGRDHPNTILLAMGAILAVVTAMVLSVLSKV